MADITIDNPEFEFPFQQFNLDAKDILQEYSKDEPSDLTADLIKMEIETLLLEYGLLEGTKVTVSFNPLSVGVTFDEET